MYEIVILQYLLKILERLMNNRLYNVVNTRKYVICKAIWFKKIILSDGFGRSSFKQH